MVNIYVVCVWFRCYWALKKNIDIYKKSLLYICFVVQVGGIAGHLLIWQQYTNALDVSLGRGWMNLGQYSVSLEVAAACLCGILARMMDFSRVLNTSESREFNTEADGEGLIYTL